MVDKSYRDEAITQSPLVKTRVKFRWILPGLYVGALLFYVALLIINIGHMPRGFESLLDLLMAPCYVVDLALPRFKPNVILALIMCIGFGLGTGVLLGAAAALILGKIRRSAKDVSGS
jgi:hypothetical protein